LAGSTRNVSREPRPPAIAKALVSRLTPQTHRSCLLGDLAEGYAHRLSRSEADARTWYWRQALRSMPPLAGLRLRSEGARSVGLILLVTAIAWLMMDCWDIYVARQSAGFLASRPDAPDLIVVRTVYFVVQAIGFALAGAGIARFAFRRKWLLGRNLLYGIGPTAGVLLVAALIGALNTEQYLYFAWRAGLAVAALIGGAYLMYGAIHKT